MKDSRGPSIGDGAAMTPSRFAGHGASAGSDMGDVDQVGDVVDDLVVDDVLVEDVSIDGMCGVY